MNPSPSNPQIESTFRRIERTSTVFRGLCTALLVAVGVAAAAASFSACTGRLTSVTFYGQSIALADLSRGGRTVVGVLALFTGVVIASGLYRLRRLLGNYSRRQIFTAESARQIRQFGISCILWGVVKAVWAFLPAMVLSRPPASIAVTVDALVIGIAVVGISWIAETAATLREENDLMI